MGVALYSSGRYQQAADAYARALELAPDLQIVWRYRGDALNRAGQAAIALDAYRQAIELDPSDKSSLSGLAVALEELGREDEACEVDLRLAALERSEPES
jgi:tetratricopeptide (TPR) repeat protein